MFVGLGILPVICWLPGYSFRGGRLHVWWLMFEVAAFPADLTNSMIDFSVECIKEDMGDGSVTYYPTTPEEDQS